MAAPEAVQMMQVAAQAAQAASEAALALRQFVDRDNNDRQKFSEASKVVKMPEAFGTEDHEADTRNWRDFLLNFKSWLFYADKTFEPGLSNVESNPKNVVSLSAMNEDSKSKAVQLYAILTGLLKGKPLRLLRQQDDRNGLEVYRQLVQMFTPQSKTRALSILQAFMQFPVFTKDKTLSEQILSLERLRSEYTRCSGQDLSDDLCLSVLVRCLPAQLRQHVQLQMQDSHTFNDIKNYALSYELTTSTWTTSKVHTELGVIPAPMPAGGPAPMEIDAVTAKSKGKGNFKGKFDGKSGKGKKGGKGKSSGKGGKFQNSWQDRQGGQGQLQSNSNSWHNHGNSWQPAGWQNRQNQWNGWNQKGSKGNDSYGKGKNDSSGKGKGGWNNGKGSWNNGRVNQMSDVAEQSTNVGGQSTAAGSTAGGSSSTAPTSAGVSSGGSSTNAGNVRLLTRVSSGFVEDLSSSGRYSGGTLHHFRVLQDLSCPIHDMTATDDDDNWTFSHCVEDLSHMRTVTYIPQPGELIEVLLDSGADGSALPLSFGHMGVSVGGPHGMNYVDAQGSPLGIQDVRVAEIHFGDVCIRDRFIIAPVTGPIISLGLLLKLGWDFARQDGCLMLVKEGHSFPIEFRKNSIVAHGTISLLQEVTDSVQDVNRSISAIRLTGLANLQEGWNKFSDDMYAIKTYAPQHVDTTLCPANTLMWLRTTIVLYYHGFEVIEFCQPISELETFEAELPNRAAVSEVITVAHNFPRPT